MSIQGQGTMLVVDDDSLNRTLLATSLEEAGYTVKMAGDGLQAMEILWTRAFDVVLLDLLMPRMDGFQVLERMKADSTLQHIPVIVISAEDDMQSVVRCIEMGATDHLPKPFDPVLLHARINASLAAKRLHNQEAEYLRNVAYLTDAAADVEAERFEPDTLTEVAARSDALGQLARVFQRMAREVYARQQRLEHQVQELRIELDEVRQKTQVAEITETQYFRQLQNKAKDLRNIMEGNNR